MTMTIPHRRPPEEPSPASPFASTAFLATLAALILAAAGGLFMKPFTLTTIYTHDTIIIFDAIHRMFRGQIPSEDFRSSLGVLTWAIPGAVARWRGQYAGSIETASVLLLAPMLLAAVLLLRQRAGMAVSAIFMLSLSAMVVVPLTPGDPGFFVSPAMHYNRWGWAAIALLGLLAIDGGRGRAWTWVEAIVATLLIVFLFYLKITYFIFGGLYLAMMLFLGAQRRNVAIVSAALSAVLIAATGLGSGILLPYIADLREGMASSGVSRNVLNSGLANINDIALFATVAIYVRVMLPDVGRALSLPFIVMLGSGLLIIDQNYHLHDIFSMITLFVLADGLLRGNGISSGLTAIPALLMVVFVSGYGLAQTAAAVIYEHEASIPFRPAISGFPGLRIGETQGNIFENPPTGTLFDQATAMRLPGTVQPPLRQGEYAYVVEDGTNLLRRNRVKAPILVFDFLDPFSAQLDLPRNPHGYAWLHPHRNISAETAPPAEEFFAEVQFVMWPLVPREMISRDFLEEKYGDFLHENFKVVARSDFWILMKRQQALSDNLGGLRR